jgi:small subunit ribosomal protein S17e
LGNVRPEKVKKVAQQLFERHSHKFTDDFEENKKVLESLANIPSKKFRNMIVGYITRLAAISKAAASSPLEGNSSNTS